MSGELFHTPRRSGAVVAIVPTDPDWRPIFHVSNQVVLYNPTSHALSIRHSSNFPRRLRPPCPYCKQSLPLGFEPDSAFDGHDESLDADPSMYSRASNYFHLLAIANETFSRPSTPPALGEAGPSTPTSNGRSTFPAENMAEGYFKAFFQEEAKLGMGANGSVFLCQHMLDGNPLGHFAVKKIAVGESHSYLLNILREVRLLERLHHPNIITYHHAWLETCQFSAFGPKVPTLHVLMQWAEGGSLDDFIDVRLGRKAHHIHIDPLASFSSEAETTTHVTSISSATSPSSPSTPSPSMDRAARIRAFRAFQRASPEEKERLRRQMEVGNGDGKQFQTWRPVHLLSAEEVKSLFKDVVDGLAFLHDKSILHLDLKPGNVLLTWDEGRLIPRAMLSDFGTSRDMISSRVRSGNTGTLEYTAPESLPSPRTGLLGQVDSKADMWSLGMILHKLLFFKLPYRYASSGDANSQTVHGIPESEKMDRLEQEVLEYPGFESNVTQIAGFEARRLPRAYLFLLEKLLNPAPGGRPSCERVSSALRQGSFDPLTDEFIRQQRAQANGSGSLVPVVRRPSNENAGPPQSPVETLEEEKEVEDAPESPSETEKTPLLRLPSPDYPETTWLGNGDRIKWTLRLFKPLWMRTLKSLILVAKVWSLSMLCPDSATRPVVLVLVVFIAIADTWFDGLRVSVVLGIVHLGIFMLARGSGICCRY